MTWLPLPAPKGQTPPTPAPATQQGKIHNPLPQPVYVRNGKPRPNPLIGKKVGDPIKEPNGYVYVVGTPKKLSLDGIHVPPPPTTRKSAKKKQ